MRISKSELFPGCYNRRIPSRVPTTPWGSRYTDGYRLICRKMLSLSGERTLVGAIVPPGSGHIHGLFGIAFEDLKLLALLAGSYASLPFDFHQNLGKKEPSSLTMPGNFLYWIELTSRTILFIVLCC